MSLYMSSTQIPAEQTIGEIQKALSDHGVMAMMTEYDTDKQVEAVQDIYDTIEMKEALS